MRKGDVAAVCDPECSEVTKLRNRDGRECAAAEFFGDTHPRHKRQANLELNKAFYCFNRSQLQRDIERRVVVRKGEEVKLTPAEYNLLVFFLQNTDRPLTRDVILNSVWGYNSFPNTRTVDAHIVKLRQKFEADVAVPRHFLTVHGVGYRFLP